MNLRIFTALICFYSFTLLAQADSVYLGADEIQTIVDKLGVKLLLNNDQKNDIYQTLTTYSTELNSLRVQGNFSEDGRQELVNSTNTKILLTFDDKQKIKYGILEKELWVSIKTEEND